MRNLTDEGHSHKAIKLLLKDTASKSNAVYLCHHKYVRKQLRTAFLSTFVLSLCQTKRC